MAGKQRIFEIVALCASGTWLVLQLGLLRWPISKVAWPLVIGGALLVAGILVYLKTDNKREVTASTVLAILGGVLVAGSLGTLG